MMSNEYEVLFSDLQIVLLFFAFYPVQSLLLWINTHRESAGPGCQDTVLNWQLIRRETFWCPPVEEGKSPKFNSNKIITELYSLHSKSLFLKHLKFSHPIFEKLIFQIKLHNFIKLFISYKHYNFHIFSVKTCTHTCWLPLHWSVVPPAWMVHSVGPPFYVSLPPSPCTPYHYGIPS